MPIGSNSSSGLPSNWQYWILAFPFLAAWPFVSVFPLFRLAGGGLTPLEITLELIFLATSFWVVVALALLKRFVDRSLAAAGEGGDARPGAISPGLVLGGLAALWLGLYALALLAG
jgi:hypothetical protein